MKAAAVQTACHLVGVFIEIWLLVDRRGYPVFLSFFLQEWHKRCFTHSASTHCLTVCVRLILRVCVCLPPSCLPASDSVPPSFSLLLLLLSLGLLTGKTPTHSLSLNPGNKRGSAAGAGLTSPGAHHLWSSSGCLSDRRVCWNIHVFFFLPCWVARIVKSTGSANQRFVECRALTFATFSSFSLSLSFFSLLRVIRQWLRWLIIFSLCFWLLRWNCFYESCSCYEAPSFHNAHGLCPPARRPPPPPPPPPPPGGWMWLYSGEWGRSEL